MWSVCRLTTGLSLLTTSLLLPKLVMLLIQSTTYVLPPLLLLKLGIRLSCTALYYILLPSSVSRSVILGSSIIFSQSSYFLTHFLSTYNLQSIRVQICFSKAVANNKRVFPVILLQLSLAKKHKRGKDEVNCPPPLNIKSYHHEKIRHSRPDT